MQVYSKYAGEIAEMQTISDPTQGNPEQALRLFFSMDLAGASKYKYSHPPVGALQADLHSWPSFFIEFFNWAGKSFWDNIRTSARENSHGHFPIEFWKTLGDEILFFSTQTDEEQPYWQLRAFILTLQHLHRIVQEHTKLQLGVKGTVWSAGFPIRNKRIFLEQMSGASLVYEGDEETLSEQTGAFAGPGAVADFMGLEMDQGFRLGGNATSGRVTASPDACYLAARGYLLIDAKRRTRAQASMQAADGVVASSPQFRIVQVGWKPLRGVLNDFPVPILWPECVRSDSDQPGSRNPPYTFDCGRSEYWDAYTWAHALNAQDYRDFFERWDDDLRAHNVAHIRPYILPDNSMDPSHGHKWVEANRSKTRQGPAIINPGRKNL